MILAALSLLLLALPSLVVARAVFAAVEGWEDADGFHGEETVTFLPPADALERRPLSL